MDLCLKKKFIPETYEEDTDINTTLFIFVQIVCENVGHKKLRVNYLKNDGECCIFDGIQDLLKKESIELVLTPMEKVEFYNFTLMNDPPDLLYVDDLLNDPVISQAMMSTIPEMSFLISRDVKNSAERFTEDYYYPLYKIGKGINELELVRFRILDLRRQIHAQTRISVVVVRSESDLEDIDTALKTSIYNPPIIVTKYPDQFGVKEKVLKLRNERRRSNVFVMFSNSDIDEQVVKKRIRANLVCSIFNNGTWGGEYYVPTMTTS